MEWFVSDSVDQGRPRQANSNSNRSGSLSDMLNHFPSPGMHTPVGEKLEAYDRTSRWPAPDGYSPSPLRRYDMQDEKPEYRGRRCCGMRLGVFIGLVIILLILIAAAVVIPIALIVLPQNETNPGSTSNAIQSCQSSNPCQNGGQSVLNANGNCSCVCTNGFTGAHCTQKRDNAGTMMSVDGMTSKATVGSAVVPLLNQAEDAFGVPLNASTILSQFSTSDVSCAFENSLVTFNGRSVGGPVAEQSADSNPASKVQSPKARRTAPPAAPAQPSTDLEENRIVTSTTNGLLVAETVSGKPFTTIRPASQPTGKRSGTMSSSPVAEQRLDFARVAVLFILQDTSSLSKATTAQKELQRHFAAVAAGSEDAGATKVSAGSGFSIDFNSLAIELPGGAGSIGGWG